MSVCFYAVLHFNFTFKLARILRRWQLGVACLDTSRLATLAEDKPRLNSTEPTEITENGSVTKAVFAANPLGESPLSFVYGIVRFGLYFEVRIFDLSFWIWRLYSRHNCYYEKTGSEVKNITDEIDFDLPDGWEYIRLSSIAYLSSGFTPAATELNSIGKIPYFKVSDMNTVGNEKYLSFTVQYYTGNKIKKIFPCNTIVFPKNGGAVFTNKKRILLQPSVVDLNTGALIPYGIVNTEYLFLLFSSIDFREHYKGTALPTVDANFVGKLLFGLPPLAEQERIVAEIEKFEPLIAEYDKLEQQATKLDGEIYDKLKKSILQYAIQGKLVPQDSNDEPASVLLERIRAEKKAQLGKKYVESYIFKGDDNCYYEKVGSETKNITDEIPFDIPDSWEWARVDTLFQHNTGKALNSANTKGNYREYITTSNLYWNYFKLDSLKKMLFTDEEIDKCSLKKGDLLVCEGGDIGRAAIWNYDIPMCIQNHIHRLRAYSSVETKFYYCVLYLYKQSGIIGGKGIGIQGLSTKALGRIIFPVPPLAEQKRIIEQINAIFCKLKDEI